MAENRDHKRHMEEVIIPGAESKPKDDMIGGENFSRVRHFDDENRKVRVFAQDGSHSVDVEKLERQIKENSGRKQAEQEGEKTHENIQKSRLQTWNETEDNLRTQRFETHQNLGDFWMKQQEASKEKRIQDRIEQPSPEDMVGIFQEKRYTLQDEELLRKGVVAHKISDVLNDQIKEREVRQQHELEDKLKFARQQEAAVSIWDKKQAEIARNLRNEKIRLANENLQKGHEKAIRNKQEHDEQHLYEIPPEYFAKFGTSSR